MSNIYRTFCFILWTSENQNQNLRGELEVKSCCTLTHGKKHLFSSITSLVIMFTMNIGYLVSDTSAVEGNCFSGRIYNSL